MSLSLGLSLLLALTLSLDSVSSQRTNYVDHLKKLEGYAEPGWFLDNIPFVELPDSEIEEVYYYRWSTHKRHLRYTVPGGNRKL